MVERFKVFHVILTPSVIARSNPEQSIQTGQIFLNKSDSNVKYYDANMLSDLLKSRPHRLFCVNDKTS